MKIKDTMPMLKPKSTPTPALTLTVQTRTTFPVLRGIATALLLATAGLAGGGGCADRAHLTKSHGRAYAEAFDRQVVNPNPPPRPTRGPGHADATEGLDSQEAAAVSRSYRRSLSGKEATEGAGQNMVITNGPGGQQSPYMPPPSVPNGQ